MGDFSPESIAKLIPMALLAFMGILTLFGALLGLLRAWKKSLLRLATIVIALILALLLTAPLSGAFDAGTLESVFAGTESDEILDVIASLPSTLPLAIGLLRPALFLALFIVLTIVLWIIYFIVSLFVRIPKKKKKRRWLGMLIGAAQGLLVAIVILTPVFGYVSLLEDTVAVYKKTVGEEEVIDDFLVEYEKYAGPTKDNKILDITRTVSKPLFKTISSFRLNDERVVLADEFALICEGYAGLTPLIEGKGTNEEKVEGVRDVADIVDKSVILPNITAEFLSGLGGAWAIGEDFLGIECPETPEEIDNLMTELYTVFSTTTRSTLSRDVDTLLDVITLYFDYDLDDAFGEGGDVFSKVTAVHPDTGKTFIVAALEVLDANPHMQPLRDEVVALGFNFIGDQLGTPEEIRENYGDMADEAATILRDLEGGTDEEKIAELTPTIKEQLVTNGVDVPDEVVDEVSKHFLDELTAQGKSLADVEGDDILDILIQLSENGTIPAE